MPAYKDKERGTWYCSFHYRDYTGAYKRKVKRGFKTKREAVDYEASFREHGRKDPTMKYAAFAEEYLDDCSRRLKPTTFAQKVSLERGKIIPVFGKTSLADITAIKVRAWQNDLITDGEYADTTLRRMHAEFSAAMNFAVRYYGLQDNPCKLAGAMGSGVADEMKIWTQEQFEQFMQHEKKLSYRLAISMLYWTGMRAGELLALTPADIDTKSPVIHITKSFAVLEGDELMLTPKTESSKRDIEIHQQLYDELMSYLDSMIIGPDERIFYFHRGGLLKEFHNKTAEAGLPQIRLHDLRHSHATWLIYHQVPITVISQRLGHCSPATTLRIYSHVYKDAEGKEGSAVTEIEKSLSGDTP